MLLMTLILLSIFPVGSAQFVSKNIDYFLLMLRTIELNSMGDEWIEITYRRSSKASIAAPLKCNEWA